MALYNYEKYSVYQGTNYVLGPLTVSSMNIPVNSSGNMDMSYFTSYSLYAPSGYFSNAGTKQSLTTSSATGTQVYASSSEILYIAVKNSGDSYTLYTARSIKEQLRGSYLGGVVAENGSYPTNGVYSDGYWYVRVAAVPTNSAPTTPGAFTSPVAGSAVNAGENITVAWGASTDANGNAITYYPEYQYFKNGVAQSWLTLVNNSAALTRNLTLTSDKSIDKIQFRIRAYDGTAFSGYHSVVYTIQHNAIPTLTLSTTDNRTLYENDSFGIAGSATDTDIGNVVSVKYQLNGGTERAITSGISTGASIPFNRSLTFKGGMLYDGASAVTPALAESTTHTLKVWAEDDKGSKSAELIRTFYVVANRPAAITIEPFAVTSNLIDTDTMTIKGNVTDPENITVVVRYKIGSGSYIEVLNGVGGPFTIPIKLSALKSGANAVTIQATDSYGAVSSKTLSIAKSGNVQPLKTSVVRYKINPPNGTAKGILLWIEREVGDLIVDAEISATMAGEAESFVPMTKTSTAFVTAGIEEDEFTHDAVTPKDNIVVKLTMTRASTATNSGIKLISGVLS